MKRRRFLTITAGLAACSALPLAALPARAEPLAIWRGTAIGSAATIAIAAPDGEAHLAAARAEITRLERVFSLYDAGSEISRLNRDGRLAAPSLDLLACLSLAGDVHRATGGLFDPTVQVLWDAYARAAVSGRAPDPAPLLARTGWDGVRIEAGQVALRPGGAITLNGIAQGFIADRVADLLTARGLADVFIDTGEMRGLGRRGADDWAAALPGGGRARLRDRALATSAPLGTELAGQSHILDPRDGRPVAGVWRSVSVSAPLAAVADGLSTAACLMRDQSAIAAALAAFPGAALEEAVAV